MRSNVPLTAAKNLGAKAQIIDQSGEFPLLVVRILDAQQRRGMDGDLQLTFLVERQDFPAQAIDGDGLSRQAARGSGAERDDELGIDQRTLDVVPPFTAFDLIGVGPLVQATLAARLEFEVLDGIGDEDRLAVETGFGNGAVEHAARRSDKGMAGEGFVVSRLFAHHHQGGVFRAFARHDLSTELLAPTAPAWGFAPQKSTKSARDG